MLLNPTQSARFRELVAQKRVVVVGPSRSIVGSRQGDRIEAFDVVVRINHQWPTPETKVADIGSRMDILYHCCNGDFPVSRLFVDAFHKTKFVCYEEGPDRAALTAQCERMGIPSMEVTKLYRKLFAPLRAYPNTGYVAITHLLSEPITELYVTGFSFHREPYYEEYLGKGNKIEQWAHGKHPKKMWLHDTDAQLRHFIRVAENDRRVTVDSRLREIMNGLTLSVDRERLDESGALAPAIE